MFAIVSVAGAAHQQALLNAMAVDQAASHHSPAFIITYHKSGWEASSQLSTAIQTVLRHPLRRDPEPKRCHPPSGCFDYDVKAGAGFIWQSGPELLCDVRKAYPADLKIFHLLRNPFDLALSSYLYHADGSEFTAHWTDGSICLTNSSTLPQFAQLTGVSLSDLRKVVALCNDLMNSTKGSGTYLERLQHQPQDVGLRLNTARTIISFGFDASENAMGQGGGADQLRMPANIVSLSRLPRGNVMNFYEPQWSDADQVRALASDIVDVLEPAMPHATKTQKQQDIMTEYCHTSPLLNDNCTAVEHPKSLHVTRTKLSSQERQQLMQMLREDDTLGPVLVRVEQVVCGTDAALAGRPEFASAARYCSSS